MSSPTVFSRYLWFRKDKNIMGLDYEIKIFQKIFLVLVLSSGTIQCQSSEATTTASPTTTSSTPETTLSPDRVWKTVDRSSYHGAASQPRPTYQKAPSSYSSSDRYSKQESSLRPSYSTSVRTSVVPVSSSGSSSTYGSSSGSQAQVGSTTLIAIPVNAQMSGSTPTITLLPQGSQTSSRVVSSGSRPQYTQNIQLSSPYYQTSNLDSYYTSSYDPLQGSSSVSRPTYYGMPTSGSSSSSMALDSYTDSNYRYPSTTYFTEPVMADSSTNSQMMSYYKGSKRPMASESYMMPNSAKNMMSSMSSMSSMPSMSPEAMMSLMGSTKGGMSSQMMMMPDNVKSMMMSDGGKSVMTPEMMMMKSANIPEFIVMMPPKTVITPELLLSLMSNPKPQMSMSPEMMMAMMGQGKKSNMGMMMPPNKMMMQQAMMAMMMKKKKEEEKEMSSISALLKKLQGLAKSLLSGGKKVKVITVKEGPALLHLLTS